VKFEYDQKRDLLYIYFAEPGTKVAKTSTITPGVFVDIDKKSKIVGIEIIDASEFIGDRIEFTFPGMLYKAKKVV